MCYPNAAAPNGRRSHLEYCARMRKLPNEATKCLKIKGFRFYAAKTAATLPSHPESGAGLSLGLQESVTFRQITKTKPLSPRIRYIIWTSVALHYRSARLDRPPSVSPASFRGDWASGNSLELQGQKQSHFVRGNSGFMETSRVPSPVAARPALIRLALWSRNQKRPARHPASPAKKSGRRDNRSGC